MKIIRGEWKEGYRLYWFLDNLFGRHWNNFKSFIGHPSDPWWITWIVDHIPGYYPEWIEEQVDVGLDERHAYAICHVCFETILVTLNVWLNLESGGDWHFDPEELPEGWSYVIEPYPSRLNLIYCPEHSVEEMQNG